MVILGLGTDGEGGKLEEAAYVDSSHSPYAAAAVAAAAVATIAAATCLR